MRLPQSLPTTAVVLVLGTAYALTVMPGVGGPTDTAKFQYLGSVLGTAHQPGYPLYTLLLALAVRLVPGEADAVAANGLSAVFTVVAAVLLCRLLLLVGVRPSLAAASAVLLGLTRTVWSQAVIAEVYGLHLALMLGVLLALGMWTRSRARRHILIALALWASSFSHATSAVLIAPAVLAVVLAVDHRALLDRCLLACTPVFAGLALLPYGYIYWRTTSPATPYLEASFTSPSEFLAMVRGSDFAGQMFAFSWQELLTDRLVLVWEQLANQPLAWAVVPALAGALVRLRDPVTWLLVLSGATTVVWGMGYDIPDVEVVFILAYACLVALTAVAVEELVRRSSWPAARSASTVVALVGPALVAAVNFGPVDDSAQPSGELVVRSLDAVGPGGGVVFSPQFHTLNYYLIGRGEQVTRQVYAPYPPRPDVVETYCGDGFVGAAANRTVSHVPRGLPVYALGDDYIEELDREVPELRIERLEAGFARILC